MKRTFDFNYYFNAVDHKICFNNGVTKNDIERTIKGYINTNNIWKEDNYLIDFNKDLELEFNIVDVSGVEYSIEVDNIFEISEY